MTRDEVRTYLHYAAENHRYRVSNKIGYGLINAELAVGGFCDLVLRGPGSINTAYADRYTTYSAHAYMGGGYSYEWITGETTQSITLATPARSEDYLIHLWVKATKRSTGETKTVVRTVYVYYNETCRSCLEEENSPSGDDEGGGFDGGGGGGGGGSGEFQ